MAVSAAGAPEAGRGADDAALARWLAGALGATRVGIRRLERLAGGAIQDNRALDLAVEGGAHAGRLELVLRADAPSRVAASRPRAEEFALLRAVHAAGVAAPEPLALCADPGVIGRPFYVMRRLPGFAAGHVIVRDDRWRGDRDALARRLAQELARVHAVRPPRAGLEFLARPDGPPALAAVAEYRAWLDGHRTPRPALEWGLRWLERHAPPPPATPALVHRDFRTGNYLVDESGLVGVLDWEFAGWGDPDEDVGWFCSRCWRFGRDEREAGGIAARATFVAAYEAASGRRVDPARIVYWETMAHARWATVALQQGERYVSGAEDSLDAALTGRRIAALERELLRMTAP